MGKKFSVKVCPLCGQSTTMLTKHWRRYHSDMTLEDYMFEVQGHPHCVECGKELRGGKAFNGSLTPPKLCDSEDCKKSYLSKYFKEHPSMTTLPDGSKIFNTQTEASRRASSERAIRVNRENIEKYGTACPVRTESGEMVNYSTTERKKLDMEESIEKYGSIAPVDSNGVKTHFTKTEQGKEFLSKKTRRYFESDSHRELISRKLDAERDSKLQTLYLINANNCLKIGVSGNFSKRLSVFTGNKNLNINRVRTYEGLNNATNELELKNLTLKYGIPKFDFGCAGTYEWRFDSPELEEDIENWALSRGISFSEVAL